MSYVDRPGISDAKPHFASHRKGRFVTRTDGFLGTATGDRIDLHAWLTSQTIDIELMPVHTNVMRASGLMHGGIVLVDRTRRPVLKDIIVVRYNGHLFGRLNLFNL